MLTKSSRINIQSELDRLTPLEVDKLLEGRRLPFDIVIKDRGVVKPLFNKGMVFTAVAKEMLREKGISEVFITIKDASLLEDYLAETKTQKTSFYDDPLAFKNYSFYKDQHHQIDRTFLIPGTKITFSLFILNKLNFSPLVHASPLTPGEINELLLNEEGDIVIKKSDIPLYNQYLESLSTSDTLSQEDRTKALRATVRERAKIVIRDILESPEGPRKLKGLGAKEKAKIVMRELLNHPERGEKIEELKKILSTMIDNTLQDRDAVYDLISLGGYDYYTYTHSVNVAALAISLGIAIGLKRAEVERLGIGAMLHDIGKSVISHEILHKQGKLDDREYRIIQSHVIEGERILRAHKEFPEEAFSAVLQHHEKLSGRGYPFRLSGKEITPFGRITAIADCYDALTTRRPYKPALTPFYALSVIAKETGNYDPDLLKIFIKMLGKIK
ncbi:MAG: HD-GYP domain-containing protein [Nitrospirota bacterium]